MLLRKSESYGYDNYTILLSPEVISTKDKKRLSISASDKNGREVHEGFGLGSIASFFSGGMATLIAFPTENFTGSMEAVYVGTGLMGAAVLLLSPYAYFKGKALVLRRAAKDETNRYRAVSFSVQYDREITTDSTALRALFKTNAGKAVLSLLNAEGDIIAIDSIAKMKRVIEGGSAHEDSALMAILPLIKEYLVKTAESDITTARNADREVEDSVRADTEQLIKQLSGIYAKRILDAIESHKVRDKVAASIELQTVNDQLRSVIEVEQISDGELSQP